MSPDPAGRLHGQGVQQSCPDRRRRPDPGDNQDGVQCNVNSFKVNEKDRNGEFKFTKEGLTCKANNSSGERSIIVRAEAGAEEGFAIKTMHNDETLTPLRIYEDNYENFVMMDLPEFTDSEAAEARVVGTLNKRLISMPVPQGGGETSTLSLSFYENLDSSIGINTGVVVYHLGKSGSAVSNGLLSLMNDIKDNEKALSVNFYKEGKMNAIGVNAYIDSTSSTSTFILNDDDGLKICTLKLISINSEDYFVSIENITKIEENIISNKLYGDKLRFVSTGNSTISLNNKTSPDIKYSLDGGETWEQWDYSAINLSDGQTVYMKGNNPNGFSSNTSAYNTFQITGSIAAHGNIMYLLDETGKLRDLTGMDYCFYQLFYTCYNLTTAPELPATELSPYCYAYMFNYCSKLTTAPELPATTLTDYCYMYMFGNCSKLTTVSQNMLPATTLAQYCYSNMFYGCSSLTNAPELPATTLEYYCYTQMFYNCTSLTNAPELPATTLADSCYNYMFYGCKSLTIAPELPATTLVENCYKGMFSYCQSLTTVPELPVTELVYNCYAYMFQACKSMTVAPSLPSTTLAEGCYQWMFYNCSSLTASPELPATILMDNCYNSMFRGCSKLNHIKCLATDISATNCTNNWVNGVSLSGFFEKDDNMTDWTYGTSGIPSDWCSELSIYNPTLQLSNPNYITLTSNEDNGIIGVGKLSSKQSLYISKNTTDWMQLQRTTVISCNSGETIYMCGVLNGNNTTSDFTNLFIYRATEISGNLNAIWDYSNINNITLKQYCGYKLFSTCSATLNLQNLSFGDATTTLANYCYNNSFYDCPNLISAPSLPAMNLANYCYQYMFRDCINLTIAPELPATTLADSCYSNMFYGCTSLTSAPELVAASLTNSCYYDMFYQCTSLTTAPELPATELSPYCYAYMFYGCTSLTTAPELPATTLANNCYQYMFNGCTSLTTVPQNMLPATSLPNRCYDHMFYQCTSLTTAPELPATTLSEYCCSYMFYGCTSLTNAPELPATTLAQYCYEHMFENCSSLTTAPSVLPAEVLIGQCYDYMFASCSSLTTVPILSATTLVNYCYREMFRDCISLTTVPQNMLPATTLPQYSYQSMFKGCTSLTSTPNLPATTLGANCYAHMFENCTSLTVVCSLPIISMNNYSCQYMFNGCTNLTTVPQNMLSTTSLSYGCYGHMFENCTSLTVAPELLATDLAYYCYEYMFQGCKSLNYIKCLASSIRSYMKSTQYWVSGVQTTDGTFVKNPSISESTWGRGNNGIPYNWTVQDNQ